MWEQTAHEGVPKTPIHLKNSYASETPVTDGERVYAYFGNVGVFCYDLAGKLLWKKDFEPNKMRFAWGTASSPVVHEGKLFIVNDNEEEAYLLGLDARTGDELFRVSREGEKSNWATPYIWKNSQRTELVTTGTKKNRSYDLEGRLLWELEGMSSITIAQPYSLDDVLYISSGYVMDKNKPIYAIRPGASGDITLTGDQKSNEYILWKNNEVGPYNPTTLLYNDLLYVLYDRGFFGCFDPATGEEVYERQRIPEGSAFTSSPWASDDKIFCLNEDGVTFVIKAGGRVRDFAHQQAGRGRPGHGHARDRRQQADTTHRQARLLHSGRRESGGVERHLPTRSASEGRPASSAHLVPRSRFALVCLSPFRCLGAAGTMLDRLRAPSVPIIHPPSYARCLTD